MKKQVKIGILIIAVGILLEFFVEGLLDYVAWVIAFVGLSIALTGYKK